ncbi:hypothetical protein GF1_16420 [Desulfolithobacter dissulfuricans]|uniref:Uncharacterized protein n=1 Tax=Desulfolithobacter dissulfuricans TaxID=2795293 RepID=A0A915XL69_9BACT|nr:hypothetical protein [Desulfolithobacter dissulfuricans]BCO09266.1 hypothetical protein GF1_16420 [Desulfolithobacter dissulfuricans]
MAEGGKHDGSISEAETVKQKLHQIHVLESIINDLTLALELWLDDYAFDEHHKIKQRKLIEKACLLIGKPRSMEELKDMVNKSEGAL